jgi:hypothetical protein
MKVPGLDALDKLWFFNAEVRASTNCHQSLEQRRCSTG